MTPSHDTLPGRRMYARQRGGEHYGGRFAIVRPGAAVLSLVSLKVFQDGSTYGPFASTEEAVNMLFILDGGA